MADAPTKAQRGGRRGGGGAGGSGAGAGGAGRARPADEGPPVDEREFDHMRAWRLEQAEGKPAYTVVSDAVLRELLRKRPRSTSELLEIKGIGAAKCDKYGESMLAALGEL